MSCFINISEIDCEFGNSVEGLVGEEKGIGVEGDPKGIFYVREGVLGAASSPLGSLLTRKPDSL